jgi:hypothetical protein
MHIYITVTRPLLALALQTPGLMSFMYCIKKERETHETKKKFLSLYSFFMQHVDIFHHSALFRCMCGRVNFVDIKSSWMLHIMNTQQYKNKYNTFLFFH